MFEFLFKYRRVLFEEGDLVFSSPLSLSLVFGALAVVGVVAAVTYARAGGRARRGERVLLAGLRIGVAAVLLFALLQPTLVVSSVVPQRNFVGILLDDSRSMNLPEEDGAPRRQWIEETFGPEASPLLDALNERFALRLFRFSDATGRIESATELGFGGTQTDIAAALDRARQDLSSVPLSGLVLVSDGAENGATGLAETLIPLQAASIPVYTVGLGAEELEPDVQVSRVELPRTILEGTGTTADVVVTHRGLAGRTVNLLVEDGPRIIAEEPVELGGDGEPTVVRIPLTLEEPGARMLRFRIPDQAAEAVTENNARTRLVDVTDQREKILYFEGEPRWEMKFARRAVEDDENIQMVVLQRTAPEKYSRYAVDGPDELLGGFPRTREELFRYRALVLGSVEASLFTRDQLQMISDFVGERGGGLLVLGGRNALEQGGYEGTAVADVLPVYMEARTGDPQDAFAQLTVRPTPAGENHPVGRLTGEGWDDLPPLSTVNRVTRVKPGATTLLEGDAGGERRVVLAHHRFGRGKALAFAVQDSWHWQMHADIPVEDQRHETLWRQLIRWLVDGVPTPVSVATDAERTEVGRGVGVTVTVFDSAYIAMNNAQVTAFVTHPSGGLTEETVPWSVEADGEYVTTLVPEEAGTYTVTVEARTPEGLLGSATTVVDAGPSLEEYFDAGRRTPLLQRIADDTGGRFYSRETVENLPEDLRYTGAGVTLTEERDLWDMPIVLIVALVLIGAEWGYRRLRGLA